MEAREVSVAKEQTKSSWRRKNMRRTSGSKWRLTWGWWLRGRWADCDDEDEKERQEGQDAEKEEKRTGEREDEVKGEKEDVENESKTQEEEKQSQVESEQEAQEEERALEAPDLRRSERSECSGGAKRVRE